MGLGSIAVPGTIGGLFHVHDKLGRLPRSVVVEPAVHYARNGIEVNQFQAYCASILAPILLATEESRRMF
ncbi:gamma-glutamyltransferase, partial [Klebsiella pneumoniae]|uniref:gamma-glutamyltransferase n=1 Tax=Klebsiella pneumoniae TaxID=573 RepID=UPI003C719F1A